MLCIDKKLVGCRFLHPLGMLEMGGGIDTMIYATPQGRPAMGEIRNIGEGEKLSDYSKAS